jgi:putative restriction endonuclease
MKFWWVNHKQTFRQEVDGGYLWSPKRERGGGFSQYYANMRIATRGDVVLSYANAVITYAGVISDDAISAPKPHEFGSTGLNWSDEGWRLPVVWKKLELSVSPKSLFGELQPLLPTKYSPLTKSGHGAQKAYFSEIATGVIDIVLNASGTTLQEFQDEMPPPSFDSVEEELSDEVDAMINHDKNLSDTQKKDLVQARRGQGVFRRNVSKIEKGCRITGIDSHYLLVASHILPWRSCTTASERLDGQNGLLLTPTIDRLFDRGLISFSDEGDIMISPRMNSKDAALLSLHTQLNVGPFRKRQKEYLAYHRENVFLP